MGFGWHSAEFTAIALFSWGNIEVTGDTVLTSWTSCTNLEESCESGTTVVEFSGEVICWSSFLSMLGLLGRRFGREYGVISSVAAATGPRATFPTHRSTYPSQVTPLSLHLWHVGSVRSHFRPRRRQVLHAVPQTPGSLISPQVGGMWVQLHWKREMEMMRTRERFGGGMFGSKCKYERTQPRCLEEIRPHNYFKLHFSLLAIRLRNGAC